MIVFFRTCPESFWDSGSEMVKQLGKGLPAILGLLLRLGRQCQRFRQH